MIHNSSAILGRPGNGEVTHKTCPVEHGHVDFDENLYLYMLLVLLESLEVDCPN